MDVLTYRGYLVHFRAEVLSWRFMAAPPREEKLGTEPYSTRNRITLCTMPLALLRPSDFSIKPWSPQW